MKTLTLVLGFVYLLFSVSAQGDEIPPIKRLLPPEGIEIPADVRERLEKRLATTKQRLDQVDDDNLKPDIEIFTKAVELALLHREFYAPKDFDKADWALNEAQKRLDELTDGNPSWTRATGLVVRGHRSSIDRSAQPFGLVIPKDHDFSKPCPLYIWLHGRGDKNTDLHFLHERATKVGQIAPPGAIVLHPFGRHCVGWKHAGEADVLEALTSVESQYQIDEDRIVSIGFSMGGAGAWHIGAHYADRFVAISPGAGFAETARYQRLTPDKYPPAYEQSLWGWYDTPCYVRNLFNTEVIAYSGELDKQIQAARVMEEAYKTEGRKLTHLIGPGVEHKYEPKTLEELLKRLNALVIEGRPKTPTEVHLQTRTLRYRYMHWVEVLKLEEHWREARVDAQIVDDRELRITTTNVTGLKLSPSGVKVQEVTVDGQQVELIPSHFGENGEITLLKIQDEWRHTTHAFAHFPLNKNPFTKGPIDDAFLTRFVVVLPSGKSRNKRFQAWMDFELAHFRDRWRALMRGELPTVRDTDFDFDAYDPGLNVVLWGDADSNAVIKKITADLPIRFQGSNWSFGGQTYEADGFVPAMVFPSPSRGGAHNYIVLNSGLTFREGHDRTNSLQNAKLPDWAIIDITQPPDAFAPGRIHDAGFFDEEWKLKSQPKGPEERQE